MSIHPWMVGALLAGLSVMAVQARPLSVPGVEVGPPRVITYHCAQGPDLHVSYWNARNGQSFARVPVAGNPFLMTNTVAASGVRYQGDRYVWWTKGRSATLSDELQGEGAPPMARCMQVER